MKVSSARIKNFRLLQDVEVMLDDATTMIVGRNNSGKTSVIELFRKLLGDDNKGFSFDDLSIEARQGFLTSHKAYEDLIDAQQRGDLEDSERYDACMRALPEISLALTIKYSDDDDLTLLAPFILDLDPDRHDATLTFRVIINDPLALFEQYEVSRGDIPTDLFAFLRKNYGRHCRVWAQAASPSDSSLNRDVSDAEIAGLVSVRFIYAQNQFDDLSSDRNHALSKGFRSFYEANKVDNVIADRIDNVLTEASSELDTRFAEMFAPVFDDLKMFGVATRTGLPLLTIEAELQSTKVLSEGTRLYYDDNGGKLPEAHNGLGYSKLVYTILQFITFYEDLQRTTPSPLMQLIFIEEPEAHLHPQMQSVFVRNIRAFMASKHKWNAQSIITTHSSHVVADSGFACIRYFDNSVAPLIVRDLSAYQAGQLATTDGAITANFLAQYMVLGRCDMFFADKVILIEGATERLLLPRMIKEVAAALSSQYISVVEVGGAYASRFRSILEFLNVQTLIVTDIDSIDSSTRKSGPVSLGTLTSNVTLRDWLPGSADIDSLVVADTAAKTTPSGRIRVAYQIAEVADESISRSFEESFIRANADTLGSAVQLVHAHLFKGKSGSEIRANAYGIAGNIKKKSDFAFDIMQMKAWTVPRYIREGLEWLSKAP